MFFYHYGNRICLKTFMFLHAIRRFIALRAHYRQNGLVPRVNRSASCSLYNSFEFDDIKQIITFAINYAKINGILLPGCIPG